MASTKIRGITIELGADTSGLQKALKGVNTEIKSTQKQLKDVERLLKLDPTNTELLEQKQRLLGNQVEQTSKKLDALKEAQKQVGEELAKTGKGQEQYDALTREIAATEKELKDAQIAAKSFNATAEKISATANKISGKFSTLASKTRALSAAAGGVVVALGGLALKAAQNADELNTLSKQTGISTAELQKMQYAADRIDVDTDTIVGGMKKLKKQLESTNAPFEELGIKTKNAKGEFRDITDIFYDSVKALSQIPNETERDVVAMQLFGKSADELAGIIDDGGAALRALGEEAENLGVIIPQEDIDKANELNDSIDQLKAQATGAFAQLGTEIAEQLLPYVPQITEKLSELIEKFGELDPEKLGLAVKIAGIIALLSPLSSTLSACATGAGALAKAFGAMGAALGVSAGVIAAVIAYVAAFAAAIAMATQKPLEFANAWGQTWEKIKQFFINGESWVTEHLGGLGEAIKATLVSTRTFIHSFLNFAEGLVRAVSGAIRGDTEEMFNGMKQAGLAFVDGMVAYFAMFVNSIIGGLNLIIAKIDELTSIDLGRIPLWNGTNLADKFKSKSTFKGGMATGGTIGSGSSAIVGEAGAEILTVANGSATVTPLTGAGGDTNVIGLLETYLPYLAAGNTIVMDSGALVGSIAPDMNAALGTIAIRGGHR